MDAGTTQRRTGLVRRVVDALAQSKADQHAEVLRSSARTIGATSIAQSQHGQVVTLTGDLGSVTLRPRDGVPAVEAELFDGTGRITVVWLGRRRIGGIEPGRRIVVTGRIAGRNERPTLFNPFYELRAPGGGQ